MQLPIRSPKHQSSSRLASLFLILSSISIVYLLISLLAIFTSKTVLIRSFERDPSTSTSLEHLVFGIISSENSWLSGKEFVRLWWRPGQMRGCVFLERIPPDSDLDINLCVSSDTSRFRDNHGSRWAIRAAHVLSDIVALNFSDDVRWYVFGDEDTVFFPDNLAKMLSKYDHRLWYYVGASSESLKQNQVFGFGMAFGGAGFAISSSLARVLAKVLDSCLERYPHLYGGDSRVYSCITELGIGMSHEPGFHQFDIRGNAFGLLAAHPMTPLVSIHNLRSIAPIFPNKTTLEALQHLLQATNVDPERILQQTVCYDRWFSWTISVSWGYAVQIIPRPISLSDATRAQETFEPWKKGDSLLDSYTLDTRPTRPDPCARPTVFFLDRVYSDNDRIIKSTYKKSWDTCPYDLGSPKYIEEVRVYSNKLRLSVSQLRAPRRQCCDLLPSSNNKVIDVAVRECKEEELIFMHL